MTDGTGMPTSKGWEVEVEPIEAASRAGQCRKTGKTVERVYGFQRRSKTRHTRIFGSSGGRPDKLAPWEMIETGRYLPRRIRGSFRGRELG